MSEKMFYFSVNGKNLDFILVCKSKGYETRIGTKQRELKLRPRKILKWMTKTSK